MSANKSVVLVPVEVFLLIPQEGPEINAMAGHVLPPQLPPQPSRKPSLTWPPPDHTALFPSPRPPPTLPCRLPSQCPKADRVCANLLCQLRLLLQGQVHQLVPHAALLLPLGELGLQDDGGQGSGSSEWAQVMTSATDHGLWLEKCLTSTLSL